jgi:Animal haem peroxidase
MGRDVTVTDPKPRSRYSRRGFLTRAGAGAGAVALSGPVGGEFAPPAQAARSRTVATSPTAFGRIFRRLPPFAEASDAVKAELLEFGAKGGPLDANDDLAAGPVRLITDPALSANNPNNPTQTAGTTFFGQFVDHDITFDAGSPLGTPTDPSQSRNARTPSLDLDSVYGVGPIASPQLYQPYDRAKLRIESGGIFEDVPRTGDGTAVIGDPRNDEHVVIAGLQAAFILFHNRAVEVVRERRKHGWHKVYEEARRLTTWHYQWLILHELLPLAVGKSMVRKVLRHGGRFYRPQVGHGFIPVEFQAAAYRFGHSMVRPSYRANLKGDGGSPFFGMIFDPAGDGQSDPVDLRGGARAARRFVGWQTFFDFRDGEVKPNKRIDTKISSPLFALPLGAIASHDQPQVLPQRTLLRHLTWNLPSGQRVARAMGETPLAEADFADVPTRFRSSTPLWYYVLREAELAADGLHLGPVGGRIVAEVLIGLLRSDPHSFLAKQPHWKPTLISAGRSFGMKHFLTFAGVDPASRHALNPDRA